VILAGLDERDARIAALRAAMAEAELDALLVAGKGHWWTGRGYLRYLTDFHLWGHDGLYLLPLSGDPFLVMSSYALAEKIARRGWIDEAAGDVYVAPRMADVITRKGLDRSRVGIVGDRFVIGAGVRDELVALLPQVRFSRADEVMDRVRAIKSPLEIAQSREHWRTVLAAMTRFQETVQPGMLQTELVAEITRPLWAAGIRDLLIFIGERPDDVTIPRPVPLACDDKLRFHLEVCGPSGHWLEITLNLAWQPPSEIERRVMDAEIDAFARIRETIRPGMRVTDIPRVFEATLRDHGLELRHETTDAFDFHGQGMDCIEYPWHAQTPPWGQSQDWILEEGMVFSYHPKRKVVGHTGWGTGLNENILITKDGPERLSGGWDQSWRPMGRR
jgi:Xaa-Pro dipeptidase